MYRSPVSYAIGIYKAHGPSIKRVLSVLSSDLQDSKDAKFFSEALRHIEHMHKNPYKNNIQW